MSLLAVLLVIVFGFFRELSIMSAATERQQQESFQLRYAETRLSSIFERIVNERDPARTFFFYTQPPQGEFSSSTSLIFTFDNGIRLDPLFSGDVLGRLYVDHSASIDSPLGESSSNRLILAVWPLHAEKPQEHLQREVLLEGVKDIRFEFYAPPERLSNSKSMTSTMVNPQPFVKKNGLPSAIEKEIQPERDVWYENEWLLAYNEMPSILKIVVTLQKASHPLERSKDQGAGQTEILTFSYVLPSSKNPIHYPADAVP
jgi:hypothetical protein